MNRAARLASMVEALYEAVLRPEEWTRFLELMNTTFDAGVAVFAHYDMDQQQHSISTIVGPLDAKRYEEHFSSRNAWVNAGHEKLFAGVVIGEQLLAQPTFERSEYYNDFLRLIDIAHVMAAAIRGNSRQFTALSILRSKRRGSFERDEVRLLEHVVPHLKRAVQIHERVSGLDRQGQPLAAVADRFGEGLILLDGRGRPLVVNRAARSILSRTAALQLTREGLLAVDPALDARLRALVQSAVAGPRPGAAGGGGMIAVPRGGSSRSLLLLVTATGSGGSWLDGGRQAAVVWLRDPDSVPMPPSEWLRLSFGLTPAEASLAELVIAGDDLKRAAGRLGVSLHTARSQLKSVFVKTGTHSQSELIRLSRMAAVPIDRS